MFILKQVPICPTYAKRPYVCPFVRPSIRIMHELLTTYCYSIKNLRNIMLLSGCSKEFLLLNIKNQISGYPA